MTTDETRLMGIEFERRLYEIYPEFLITQKLDTDTIYSFLNEYQNKYIKELYLVEDLVERGSRGLNKLNDTIKTLVKHKRLSVLNKNTDADNYSTLFAFPEDYFLYIRSASIVDSTYKSATTNKKRQNIQNYTIKQADVPSVVDNFYNHNAIMRNPLVIMESTQNGPYIKVLHDVYTDIAELDLTYYRQPYAFNVLGFDDNDMSENAVHSYCLLPFSCFDELVTGAIDLYIQNYKFKLASNNNKRRQKLEDDQ